jgi:hypothetical protein
MFAKDQLEFVVLEFFKSLDVSISASELQYEFASFDQMKPNVQHLYQY